VARTRNDPNMKSAFHVILYFVITVGVLYASTSDSLTPQQRLSLLPLPQGVSVEQNADISTDPIFQFSKQHLDFFMIDPFSMERRSGSIPEYAALKFTTPSEPRDVFLFFKRFFNMELLKPDSERTQPVYNSRSYFDFDAKNDASVTRDQTVGDAVFYRIVANAGNGHKLDIVIFNLGNGNKTTVYVVASDKKS